MVTKRISSNLNIYNVIYNKYINNIYIDIYYQKYYYLLLFFLDCSPTDTKCHPTKPLIVDSNENLLG